MKKSSIKHKLKNETDQVATENDPLLLSSPPYNYSYTDNQFPSSSSSSSSTTLRERRHSSPHLSPSSKSSLNKTNLFFRKIQSSIATMRNNVESSNSIASGEDRIGSSSSSVAVGASAVASIPTATSADDGDEGVNGLHPSHPSRSYDPESGISFPSSGDTGNSSFDYGNHPINSSINSSSQHNIRSLRSLRSARSHQLSTNSRGSYSRAFSSDKSSDYQQQQYQSQPLYGQNSQSSQQYRRRHADKLHEYYNERAKTIFSKHKKNDRREEPLIEVNAEVLAVRKRALKVYEPLTYTWVSFSCYFSFFLWKRLGSL